MAKLPDQTVLGPVRFSAGGPTPSADVSGIGRGQATAARALESAGSAITGVGNTMFAVQEREAAKQGSLEEAQAGADFSIAKDNHYTKFSNDPDYDAAPKAYREESYKSLNDSAAAIKDPYKKQLFIERGRIGIETGANNLQDRALKLNNEKTLLSNDERMNELASQGLANPDDAYRRQKLEEVNKIIDGEVASRLITPKQAVERKRKFIERYGESYGNDLINRDPEKALEFLDKVVPGKTAPVGPQSSVEQSPKGALAFFQSKGLSREQAAGVVGNLMQESGMDPTLTHDGGIGIGIAGWNKERRTALQEFAKGRGKGETDYQTQLEFAWSELSSSEKATLEKLKKTKTPDEAARIAQGYFRPGVPVTENRIKYANQVLEETSPKVANGLLNVPDLKIQSAIVPGATYGRAATQNAQPFSALVVHHTGTENLESALNVLKGDSSRGGASFGYHFYIDRDGSIYQGAPLDARTNHVKGPLMPQRTSRPDIANENAVGISFVGSGKETPQQIDAGKKLSTALMQQFSIDPKNVVGHGELQSDRQGSEGMALVKEFRDGGGRIQVASLGNGAVSDASPERPAPEGVQVAQANTGTPIDFLRPDQLVKLRQKAELAIKARAADEERQLRLEEKAVKQASDAEENNVLKALYPAEGQKQQPLSAKDIVHNDKLTREAKERLIPMVTRLEKPEPPATVSARTARDLLDRMRRPEGDPYRISDMGELYKPFVDGDLSKADFEFVRKEFTEQRSETGDKLTKRKTDFLNSVKGQITKSNPLMGRIDPSGDQQLYHFDYDVQQKVDAYRKEGKNPHDLFDPSKPDYLGKPEAIAPYQKTLQQSLQDRARALSGRPAVAPAPSGGAPTLPSTTPQIEPRKPGESPADYLKRTGKL